MKKTIDEYAEEGNALFDQGKMNEAIEVWEQGLQSLLQPLNAQSEAVWFQTSIADACFMQGKYEKAYEYLFDAKSNLSGEGYSNPFVMLRLGQCAYELNRPDEAKEYLLRAYMSEGEEIFSEEDPKYLKFIDQKRKKHVVVEAYNEAWKQDFIDITDDIREALGDLAVKIEHVGSTSVPGLSAKPIIDIDIVIKDYSVFEDVVASLASIGYHHEGDLGIPGREAFKYDGKDNLRKHHLYVCTEDSKELRRHLAFRDYLLTHPDAVAEYSRVKQEGAALYPYDIDSYIAYKSPLIEKIYREIGL